MGTRGALLVLAALASAGCVSPALLEAAGAADAGPCEPVALTSDREGLIIGDAARIVLVVANCGDAPAAPRFARGEGSTPIVLARGAESWFLESRSATAERLAPDRAVYVAAPVGTLAPGAKASVEFAWDGTVREACAAADGCKENALPAEPGHYLVESRVRWGDGPTYEAALPLVLAAE